jgi:hypothetical protein
MLIWSLSCTEILSQTIFSWASEREQIRQVLSTKAFTRVGLTYVPIVLMVWLAGIFTFFSIPLQVYMIDFGLAKKYRDSSTHQHIPYRWYVAVHQSMTLMAAVNLFFFFFRIWIYDIGVVLPDVCYTLVLVNIWWMDMNHEDLVRHTIWICPA